MRLSGTKTSFGSQSKGFGSLLYDIAGERPTLDLNFASNGSLVDSVTGKTLVTHTRASNATYVDGDGIIKDAVTNLLLHSEPDASLTGWTIGFSTGTFSHTIIDSPFAVGEKAVKHVQSVSGRSYLAQNVNANANTTYTVSFYVDKTQSQITSGDIVILSVSNITGGTISGDDTLTFSDAVNGKNSFTFTTSSGVTAFQIRAGLGNFGNSTGTLVFGNLQLEQSSTAGEYVKTTSTINSAPRFDHDPGTGESLGLLVEESRTNLLSYSEEFDQSVWAKVAVSVTANQRTAPDGTLSMDTVTVTGGAGFLQQAITVVNSTVYTASTYVYADSDKTRIIIHNGTSDICNVSWTSISANTTTVSGTASNITSTDVGNGIYRLSFTFTSTSTTANYRIQPLDSSGNAVVGATGYFWGAQLEAGSFPTSYIRTDGTPGGLTRSADVTSIEGNDFGTFNLLQYSEEFDNAAWTKGRASITPNVVASPDNTFTADKFTPDTTTTTTHYMDQGATISGGTYTASIYLKQAGYQYGGFRLVNNSFGGDRFAVVVDLSNGTVTDTNSVNSPTPATYSVESVGNGWYRLSATLDHSSGGFYVTPFASPTATPSFASGLPLFTGDGTSGIYVWGAQLEQSSTATPYVKSDVTWTSRASNATYYDSTGTLRKSSYNELLWSEEFDRWTPANITLTTNAVEAPDGTLTAEKVEGVNTVSSFLYQAFTSALTNTTYTFSFWIKSVDGSSGTWGVNYYNGSSHYRTTVPVTGEWNRVSVQFSNFSSVFNNIYIADNRDDLADLTEAYIWGAQLETGPYAGDYVKTEGSAASSARNVAFLPDGSGNFVSAGELLLEDAGTNLITYSEEFDQWSKAQSSVTVNQITAPDGTLTADKLVENTDNDNHYVQSSSVSVTGPVSITGSVYLKKGERRYARLRLQTTAGPRVWFDLESGTQTAIDFGCTATITDVGNGWYRCAITALNVSTTSALALQVFIQSISGNQTSYAGDGTSGIYVWGAQLETSSYPTSYIPTYGSTATRAADVSSSSSNTFGNSFYNQTEGTVFSDSDIIAATQTQLVWRLTGGTYSTSLRQPHSGSQFRAVIGNTFSASPGTGGTIPGVTKAAVSFSGTAGRFQVGTSGVDVTAAGASDPNVLNIGTYTTANQLNGTIARLTYWPTRLSNDTLQTITK